ncbi:MAG: hypothetical protein KDB07_09550 [Planctomycetes bacterium]|nr:hypothetical protein [Planctomycetota bacterium]
MGCTDYASQVLQSNIIVAALDHVFVPVFIRNSNGNEHDKAILKEFKEPAWNYPVARFLNAERKELIERLPDVWKSKTMVALVAGKLLEAIEAGKYEVADEALKMLKDAKAGKTWKDEAVAEVVEALDGKIGKALHKALDACVKAYEKRDFAKARELASKVQADEKSEPQAKSDAAWAIAKIDTKFASFKARVEDLKKAREYLELFATLDKRGKHFEGLEGAADWLKAFKELEKDKAVKAEVKALESFEKYAEQLAKAKDDKAKEAATKKLKELAEKQPDTKAAEKAKALLGEG